MSRNGSWDLLDTSETRYVRTASPSDYPRIRALYEERWGTCHDELVDEVRDHDGHRKEAFVAVQGDAILGFLTLFQVDGEEFKDWAYPAPVDVSPITQIGHVQMLAVDADHESTGVGADLLGAAIQHCERSPHTDWMGAVCWHRDGVEQHDSRPLFEKHGFAEWVEIERIYAREEPPRTTCPDCEGTCECAGTVYSKPIRHE